MSPAARLFSRSGDTAGTELRIGHEATIGRTADNTLVIDRSLMSSHHARLTYDPDHRRYLLEDLDSLNGTELDGDRISGPQRLGHLHVITFAGTYEFFFQDLERCARRHSDTAEAPAVSPPSEAATDELDITRIDHEPIVLPGVLTDQVDEARASADHTMAAVPVALPGALIGQPEPQLPAPEPERLEIAFLLIVDDPGGGALRFPLRDGDNLVGRGTEAQVRLNNPDLSRRHAIVKVAAGTVRLLDLGSRNHTFVDDRPIDAETEIRPGVELRFGSVGARLNVERKAGS